MKEYAVYKGRGDSYVELYRADSKQDATNYWLEKSGRNGDCDKYTETLVTKTMIWFKEGSFPLWLQLSEEEKA